MPNGETKLNDLLGKQKALEKNLIVGPFHWLIVAASLVLTFTAWYMTYTQVEAKKRELFEKEKNTVIELITERLKKYEDALWSGVAAVHSQSHGIDYPEWKRFADTLEIEERYPGINGIGIIYSIKTKELLDQLIHAEQKYRPDFHVHPSHDQDEYMPIVYIEPQNINSKAVGLDMAHETNRFTAAKKARDTGASQITGPITLVQDQEKTPGFLFYAPFYKLDTDLKTIQDRQDNFIGMVYAAFIMNKLMDGTLAKEKRLVGISITDDGQMLYDEHIRSSLNYDASPIYAEKIKINIYGRIWELDIWTLSSFRDATNSNKPTYLLMTGLLIEALIIYLFILLSRANKNALRAVKKLESNYKKTNETLLDLKNFQGRILDNIPDLVFVKNSDLKIASANKAFMSLFPKEKQQKVIGYTLAEDFDRKEAEDFFAEDRKALKDGHSETIEKIKFPNGSTETLFTKKIAFKNKDGEDFILGIARNITELKRTEEALINSNIELERFAFVAAHDMQEPVRMVKNFAEILEQTKLSQLDEQGQKYLKECIKGANHIQLLIGDLLELSKISHQSHAIEEIDMQKAYDQAIENLEDRIKHSSATINLDKNLPKIMGNSMCTIRLIQNLIGNAIKYQSEENKPVIEISYRDAEDIYEFAFKDNGIGINEKYHQQIFEPFKKLHHHTVYNGTGIGLSVCKRIVEIMGGQIWVTSEEGCGTTFHFTTKKPKEGN